ncbi:uncharacterized protein LOC132272867 [Cornus florida]|uniref:uncharacterized protein LOC132272867 n=1 Tax=Cornus florida TaxID=4283 RepID=UPI002899B588|nr:uncharacterized protein LOC132272867 [Cornus florida]
MAVQGMGPYKAPGPDGFTPLFFQNNWDLMKTDLVKGFNLFLSTGFLTKSLNHTNITLIPKVRNPAKMTQFWPISLCNVIYKIYSKVLANRLKPLLSSLISENQSAFVPNRLIHDNVMLAQEVLHYLKKKKNGKTSFMALKLDMAKAYDKVECEFIQGIMEHMGFAKGWIKVIMGCVRSVSYSILINGESGGLIFPSWGLRQGDPLSPFLFLLCTEGFSLLLKQAVVRRHTHGICIGRSLFFSSNADPELKEMIRSILHIQESAWVNKYLGLPAVFERSKSASLKYLSEEQKFRHLKTSYYLKPIQSQFIKFWWSGSVDKSKICWRSLLGVWRSVILRYLLGYSNKNIFLMWTFLNHTALVAQVGSGGVLCLQRKLFLKALDGALQMGKRLIAGLTIGFLILLIPELLPLEKKIWGATPNGKFTVRSAYRLAMQMQYPPPSVSDATSRSCDHEFSSLWKTIWKLKVPQKDSFVLGSVVMKDCLVVPTRRDNVEALVEEGESPAELVLNRLLQRAFRATIVTQPQLIPQLVVQVEETPAQKRLKIIKGFSQLMPVMFEDGVDPMVADDYMKQVETQLTSMDVTEDHFKIILATYKFTKDAKFWCKSITNQYKIEEMSWDRFKELFYEKYLHASNR